MFSKKAILEASVYLLGDEEIDEEEFLAIYEIVTMRRKHPYKHYERIEDVFDAISPEEFQTEFRFGITELPLLLQALKIPDKFICFNGTASPVEGWEVTQQSFIRGGSSLSSNPSPFYILKSYRFCILPIGKW